ncbi:Fe-S cluster assembly protein SufD [Sphingomonas jejuensis]|uniref:Fe-S cluster assembly protein SufD n=1 Tax=Sphingomonas jejuensis TaxID=904715 RepID=A0ABX0XQS3_9SPHN|nr:SufD family Fe-S cluster assembly protein [Sphingomonas jejuensis]NJC35046.1 Fe-S cluster assembly protein SufD [Sphingomonas jejuensis]
MTLTLPSAREEAWRWTDLSGLPAIVAAVPDAGRDALALAAMPAAIASERTDTRLLFVDGVLHSSSTPGRVRLSAVDARTDHALGRHATADGWTLDLAPGQIANVEVVHVATGAASHVPAHVILAPDAVASVTETFVGDGWTNRFFRAELGKGARLMRAVRLLHASGFQSLRDEALLGEGASLVATVLGAGEGSSRVDALVTIAGEQAFAEYGGAMLARGEQRHEAAAVVRHAAPHGQSHQSWRAVADDRAVASLAARVEVARHAQKTDGIQSLKGLLLKRTATVNIKPELEIFADDVKCAHGATVGELDRQSLFYLASRGVDPARARAILTRAFVADALDRIGEEAVRDAFVADADRWLDA